MTRKQVVLNIKLLFDPAILGATCIKLYLLVINLGYNDAVYLTFVYICYGISPKFEPRYAEIRNQHTDLLCRLNP